MTCYLYDTKDCPMLRVCCSETQTQEDVLTDVLLDDEWHIVLFNDNHNTFDHVIDASSARVDMTPSKRSSAR